MTRRNTSTSRASRAKLLGQFPIDELKNEHGELPSWSHRIAHFLDWWARKMPYDFVGFNEILKAVEKRSSMPRLDTRDVTQLRGRIHGARRKLQAMYGRDTVILRGMGVRATVDSDDMVINVAPKRVVAAARKLNTVAEMDAMIDLKKVSNSPYKKWYAKSVRGLLQQISTPDFLDKLLPPKPEDKDKDKKD